MAWFVKCDKCGKESNAFNALPGNMLQQMELSPKAFLEWLQKLKPREWMQRADDIGIFDACSVECASGIDQLHISQGAKKSEPNK